MKPIVIISVPARAQFGVAGGRMMSLAEMMDIFQKYAEGQMKEDGNVLCLPLLEGKEFKVDVFNAENIKDFDVEKLKEEIKAYAKSLEPKSE